MVRDVGRAQGRNSKACSMLLRMNLNHHPGDRKACVLKYSVSTVGQYICIYEVGQCAITYIYEKTCINASLYTYTYIYNFFFIYIYMEKHKDFSGDIFPLVLACLAIVRLSFAFPATNQNEIGSKKACLPEVLKHL